MVRWLLLSLTLLASPAGAESLTLTIRPEPRHKDLIAGEMLPVTIRAVYDRKVANEKLEIAPSESFDWIQTAPDSWRQEIIDGLPWQVMERHLALFPRRSGVLHFGPVFHHLTIIDEASQRQPREVKAQPVEIPVGPFPADRGWKLAAERLTLRQELSTDPTHLADGETVTRRITLTAEGALPEMLPPRPVVSENWLITFAAPVERKLTLTAEGPVAEVVWTWQFRPETGEPGVIEPVTIPYFDSNTRRMESVEIPPLSIGYASFAANRATTGRFGMWEDALSGAAIIAGVSAGTGVMLWRSVPASGRAGWKRLRRRWSPLPRLALRRAARSGDPLALRRAAEAYLDGRTSPAIRSLLAGLDRRIYGPEQHAFQPGAFVRDLRRAAGRSEV